MIEATGNLQPQLGEGCILIVAGHEAPIAAEAASAAIPKQGSGEAAIEEGGVDPVVEPERLTQQTAEAQQKSTAMATRTSAGSGEHWPS